MRHHMQLRSRAPTVKPQEQKKNKTNKLMASLKELFGASSGLEIYEQAKKHNIKYIEEIDEKGYEIVFLNSKIVLKKKNDNRENKSIEQENITESEFERIYTCNINKYKEQIYYDLFLGNAKMSSIQIKKKRGKRKKKPLRTKNNTTNTKKTILQGDKSGMKTSSISYDQDDSSCFTSEPSSPYYTDQYLNTNKRSNQGTPIINSFECDFSVKHLKDSENELSSEYANTEYLSDKEKQSEISKKAIKIQQFDADITQKEDLPKQKNQNASNTTSNQNSNDDSASQIQTKMLVHRKKKLKLKNSIMTNLSNTSQDEEASKEKKQKEDEENLLLYQDYHNINIFEKYDNLFLKLQEEFYMKKEQQKESEIIPITHSSVVIQEEIKGCDKRTYSPIVKLDEGKKIIPKKLKSKVSKKYPQINRILRKDNLNQKLRIHFKHPLEIYNASNWFKYD